MNRSEPRDIKRIKAHGPFEPRQYVSAGIEFIDEKEAAKSRFGHEPRLPLDTHRHLIKGADAATAEATGSVLKELLKFCGVAALAWLVFAHLGPTNWQPRTGLGWQIEHFLGYFLVASIVCLASPRPFVVGVALMAAAPLLEALQGWIPDRHPNFLAALYGAGGALVATLLSVARNSLH